MTIKKLFAVLSIPALGAGLATAQAAAPKPEAVMVCATCHGEAGVSTSPLFPNLAGQHRDYLIKALTEYKGGLRKNAIMSAQAANLSVEDIKALALWFSTQKPVLYTVDPEPTEGAKAPATAAK